MSAIKLAQLPDRTPVKLTVHLPPELNQALIDYAALYAEVYGRSEAVHDLVPAMLGSFLDGDRLFVQRRRGGSRP